MKLYFEWRHYTVYGLRIEQIGLDYLTVSNRTLCKIEKDETKKEKNIEITDHKLKLFYKDGERIIEIGEYRTGCIALRLSNFKGGIDVIKRQMSNLHPSSVDAIILETRNTKSYDPVDDIRKLANECFSI